MIASIRDRALGLGGKIHPLIGPIFTGRPNATRTGDPCAMCVTPQAAPADTAIRRRNGSQAYLCLEHDLMLHQAVGDLDRTMNAYEQQVLAQILFGADQRTGCLPSFTSGFWTGRGAGPTSGHSTSSQISHSAYLNSANSS